MFKCVIMLFMLQKLLNVKMLTENIQRYDRLFDNQVFSCRKYVKRLRAILKSAGAGTELFHEQKQLCSLYLFTFDPLYRSETKGEYRLYIPNEEIRKMF